MTTAKHGLIAFLTETLHDLDAKTHRANSSEARLLFLEAEEIMNLRTLLIKRFWNEASSATTSDSLSQQTAP